MTDIQSVEADVKRYKGLDVLAKSEGGVTLVDHLKERIASDVEVICSLLKGTDTDIRAAIAQLKADLYVYRVLRNAEQNAKIASEELERLLKQEEETV